MTETKVQIERLSPEASGQCEAVMRGLPDWFGIEESILGYRRDTEVMETYGIHLSGELAAFITIKTYGDYSGEIQVMAVREPYHRKGLGRRLVTHVERLLRDRGVEYLQVKTLGPSRPDTAYDRTREFYLAMGFRPLEEFKDLWPGNPCLVLIKRL